MRNFFKVIGIVALAAVIGFGMAACDTGGGGKSPSGCSHEWGAWEITKAPTETAKGERTRTCTKCSQTEKQEIAALGGGGYSSGNLIPAGGYALDVLMSFEWDDDYIADNPWGGQNPAKPDGYQIDIYPDELLGGNKITVGDKILLTVKFTSDRAVDAIVFAFIDDSPEADYWTALTKYGVLGIDDGDGDDEGFMIDDLPGGIVTGTPYEYEIEFTARATATSANAAMNNLYILIDTPHLATYPTMAAAEAAMDTDKITLNFTWLSVDLNK